MTHKPNILALNFTHQNKDEKNFVDTAVLLASSLDMCLPLHFCLQGLVPCVGPSS